MPTRFGCLEMGLFWGDSLPSSSCQDLEALITQTGRTRAGPGAPEQGVFFLLLPCVISLPRPPPHYTHHHTHTAPSYHLGGLDPLVPALILQKRSLVLQALSLLFLHLEDKSQNALCPGPSLPPLLTELLRFRVSPGFLCPFSPTLAQFHSG